MVRTVLDLWVPEEDQRRFFRIEQTLGELRKSPRLREAASTLFWQIYFKVYEVSDEEALFTNILDLLISGEDFDSKLILERAEDERINSAFVQLHLATILLMVKLIRNSWNASNELVEDLIKHGLQAREVIPAQEHVDKLISSRTWRRVIAQMTKLKIPVHEEFNDEEPSHLDFAVKELRKCSLCAVMAIFMYINVLRAIEEKNYLNILKYVAYTMAYFKSSCHDTYYGPPGIVESVKPYNTWSQTTVDSFEKIIIEKRDVDWANIAEWCALLADQFDAHGISEEIVWVADSEGVKWEADIYWHHAATRAEAEMSPSQYKVALDITKEALNDERKRWHKKRLTKDYFGELIDMFDKNDKALEALISMEIAWYDSAEQGGREDAMVNELRHVFENMLHSIIFSQKQVKQCVDGLLNDSTKQVKMGIKLQSKNSDNLSATEMANLLKRAQGTISPLPELNKFIEEKISDQEDRRFLYIDLPRFLFTLAPKRAAAEHHRLIAHADMTMLRNRALGIETNSYIKKLLLIKKKMLSKVH